MHSNHIFASFDRDVLEVSACGRFLRRKAPISVSHPNLGAGSKLNESVAGPIPATSDVTLPIAASTARKPVIHNNRVESAFALALAGGGENPTPRPSSRVENAFALRGTVTGGNLSRAESAMQLRESNSN